MRVKKARVPSDQETGEVVAYHVFYHLSPCGDLFSPGEDSFYT